MWVIWPARPSTPGAVMLVRMDQERLADDAVALVADWLQQSKQLETSQDRKVMDRFEAMITDPGSLGFVMQFVDRVIRPDSHEVAAAQLRAVVSEQKRPRFLGFVDNALLVAGAKLSSAIPGIVIPLARKRMRQFIGTLVLPAEPAKLASQLELLRSEFQVNVNLLGEAVLGEREAQRRLDDLLTLVNQSHIDYVSVKISAVASQLNHFARHDSLKRVTDRLEVLVEAASRATPETFINFDMEEYHDLELTMEAFMEVLSKPEHRKLDAGIVLQAYLPDALGALQRLVGWANSRHEAGGGQIKIRLVKGANLAMERVEAAIKGWEQTPYETKVESDANYKRCLEWLLEPAHMAGVRLGLASHNLFDVAWTHLLARARGVEDRVQFEMLQGMATSHQHTVNSAVSSGGTPMLLYTPAVRDEDFDVSISYLFRRLEENAADENFLRHIFNLSPGTAEFATQEKAFRRSLELRDEVSLGPRRSQNRLAESTAAYEIGEHFLNEPETDPTLKPNQEWIALVMGSSPGQLMAQPIATVDEVDVILDRARTAQVSWGTADLLERQKVLHRVGDELAKRRGELIITMIHEANKTFVEADVEVAEAIDFARWYGDRATEATRSGVSFEPLGVVAVVPPWNFPVAIPAGGVLASLAAGNAVVLKPAPETPRCAEVVAEACWAGGISTDLLTVARTPENNIGQHLITHADGVILTGSAETAELFAGWKPDLRLFAETSGKNALIVTPNADIDLAVADLARSAFGHSGQKCSAASLAILVGDVYSSERFRRQLIDAVESMDLGPSARIETTMGPLIGEPNARLLRGLSELDPEETWLVEPTRLANNLWSPGVRDGVKVGSWFHSTECFGPVLGLMFAADLEEAIAIQNSSAYGLTGGIHSLDPNEIDQWLDKVEVGNAYVNRAITGAIVQRQPFGGWKRSSVGPGAKAGGLNYVHQLGTWTQVSDQPDDYAESWKNHFAVEHDPTGLFCEANIFRYRPLTKVLLRINPGATQREVDLVKKAAQTGGVKLELSDDESESALAVRLGELGVERVRVLGEPPSEVLRRVATASGVYLATEPVTAVGRIELLHYIREQAISRTLHRFGNLVGTKL